MEVRRIEKPKKFEPVTIELNFKTQEELDDFHSIFNHAYIVSSCCLPCVKIRDSVDSSSDDHNFSMFDKKLTNAFRKRLGVEDDQR